MNLLLLLSALLSAITGLGGSVRAPDVAQAVAGASVARAAPAARQVRTAPRPAVALPALIAVADSRIPLAVLPTRPAPIWMDRRRE